MYGKGSLPGVVLGTATTAGAASILPRTGVSMAIELALAAAAGLVVWALVYGLNAKFGKR